MRLGGTVGRRQLEPPPATYSLSRLDEVIGKEDVYDILMLVAWRRDTYFYRRQGAGEAVVFEFRLLGMMERLNSGTFELAAIYMLSGSSIMAVRMLTLLKAEIVEISSRQVVVLPVRLMSTIY
jgi:hypothetical protein